MTVSTDYPRTLDLALAATRAGHLDEADKLLREASRLQPAEALPHFLLGANAAEAGRNDAAESEYIACLSRAPGMAIARFQLGLLQVTNGRPAAGPPRGSRCSCSTNASPCGISQRAWWP